MISRYLSGRESRETLGLLSQAGRGQLPVSSEVKDTELHEQYLNSHGGKLKQEATDQQLLLKFLKIRF